jgi:NAD(P)-dependent dehydrogenase (short-subunit alcohol dehydrogenase family)
MLVRRLSEAGWSVHACVESAMQQDSLRAERIGRVTAHRMDVTDAESVQAVAAACGSANLVCVVNLAAVVLPGPLEHVPLEHVVRSLDVIALGSLRVARAFLPLLRKGTTAAFNSRIVNISSGAGVAAVPMHGPYCMGKHALNALTGTLRQEVEASGVRVVGVAPGMVATPTAHAWEAALGRGWQAAADEQYRDQRELAVWHQNQMLNSAIGVSEAVSVIAHACACGTPRAEYLVGFEAHTAAWLYALAPPWLSDRLLRLMRTAARHTQRKPLVG